jgi:pimeloyl-ACP methyl ester carboxylesterase
VDDTLVQVLLDPLLTPGASQVVFDLLSYSAGPLPEQQLQQFPLGHNSNNNHNIPVWVVYGDQDPWTPGPRVEALQHCSPAVERVVPLHNVGHCPPHFPNHLLMGQQCAD